MTKSQDATPDAVRERLRAAMALHAEGDIDGALEMAREALEIAPDSADTRSYLGSTLVMRRGRYREGLAELERARDAAPLDAAIWYTLGWCYEFAAHGVARRARPDLDAQELYREAEAALRRCLDLNPEGKLKDDAQDLLSSIIKEDVG